MLSWYVVQVRELEAQQTAVNAELTAIRKAVADDNEEFVIKGVKGVNAAQELISKLCYNCFVSTFVHSDQSNNNILHCIRVTFGCLATHRFCTS